MKTSPYLEQTVFYEQSSAAHQNFESRSDDLFSDPGITSIVDIHTQLPGQLNASDEALEPDSKSVVECSSVPPSPLDRCHYLDGEPPRYSESRGLERRRIREGKELEQTEMVRSR